MNVEREPSTGGEFFVFQNVDGKRNLFHSKDPNLSITIVCSHDFVLFFVGSFSLDLITPVYFFRAM